MTPPKSGPKVRLDLLLVERGLATDVKKARALILAGQVVVSDQRAQHAGDQVAREAPLRIKTQPPPFVSRAGEKLAGLIQNERLEDWFRGKVVMDVGASTGGFTDCALQSGADRVVAVDVGTNQLAWSLRKDERVECLEKTDIRKLTPDRVADYQLILSDLSFISLTTVLPALAALTQKKLSHNNPKIRAILLIKPQFEVPKSQLPEGGVVDDPELEQQAINRVLSSLEDSGFTLVKTVPAPLKGRGGNQEHFCLCEMSFDP